MQEEIEMSEEKKTAVTEEVKEEARKLTEEELEQVSGARQRIPVILAPGAPPIYIGDYN